MLTLPVGPGNSRGLLAQDAIQGRPVTGHHADGVVIGWMDDYPGY